MSSSPLFAYRPPRGTTQSPRAAQPRYHPYRAPSPASDISSINSPPGISSNSSTTSDDSDTDHLLKECLRVIRHTDLKVASVQSTVTELQLQVKNIQTQLQQQQAEQLNLKTMNLEKSLRIAVAKVFCTSIERQLPDDQMLEIVASLLGSQSQTEISRQKSDILIKGCKDFMATFRGEERRRVYGRHPVEKSKNKSTESLANELIQYFKAPCSVTVEYTKNLALLRLYVQLNPDAEHTNNFYKGFRGWMTATFPSGTPSEDALDQILTKDKQHDYFTYPVSPSPEELAELSASSEELDEHSQ